MKIRKSNTVPKSRKEEARMYGEIFVAMKEILLLFSKKEKKPNSEGELIRMREKNEEKID